MLNGSVPNDELFGIIYTVDEGDDWTDPQVLEKANPNIGVSVYREFLLSQQQRAKNNARLANVFKTKHLNIWVSARSAYFNLVSWQSCEDKSLTLEQFEGQPCILAFDLARKLDMNSMARLYIREIDGKTHYYSVAPRFWVTICGVRGWNWGSRPLWRVTVSLKTNRCRISPLMRKPLHLVTSNGVTPSLTVSAPAFCVTRTPINRLSVFIPPSAPAGCWSIRRPSNC